MVLMHRSVRWLVLAIGFVIVAGALLLGSRATPVSAHPIYSGTCGACHSPDSRIQVSATPIYNSGGQTTYSFTITPPYQGIVSYRVSSGNTVVVWNYGINGTFTVPNGGSYELMVVVKPDGSMGGSATTMVYPTNPPGQPTVWDQSHVEVFGRCSDGQVIFTVGNLGLTMNGTSQYRIYVDGALQTQGGFRLGPNQVQTVTTPGGPGNVQIQADQRPLHPAGDMPSWTVSGCVFIPPDLVPTSLTAPTTAIVNQQIPVTWTVQNQGLGDAKKSSWNDRVYLSADPSLSSDDTLVGTVGHSTILMNSDTYTATVTTSKLPNVAPGTYRLIIATDADGRLEETSEANNTMARDIQITASDLAPTSFMPPAVGIAGQQISLVWTVTNQGNGNAVPSWIDRVYLSTDNTLSADDPQIGSLAHAAILADGDTYTASVNATLPNVSSGSYYAILSVDADARLPESNDSNNTAVGTIMIGAPDLTPTNLTSPANGVMGQQIPVAWTVGNQGSDNALPSWNDRLYLSIDNSLSSDDAMIGSLAHSTALAGGSSYTANLSPRLPGDAVGSYYLILATDADSRLSESNETNNSTAVAIQITAPDLIPTSFTPPSTGITGQTIALAWTVRNQGNGNATPTWTDRVYLSTDNTLSSDDALVGSLPHSTALVPGDSYNATLSPKLPVVTAGSYYLILAADSDSRLSESNETNNSTAVAIQITAPDLIPTSFTPPST
ncbi:MAG: hypothetical protein EPO21_03325, partial [Chloroflexota bacterium]